MVQQGFYIHLPSAMELRNLPPMKLKLLFAFVSLTFFSCGKYEEGPKISFASKKARVANTWAIEKKMMGSTDITGSYRQTIESESYVMEEDGKYSWIETTVAIPPYPSQTTTETGTWQFANKDKELTKLSNAPGSITDTYTIVRLKNNEMWLRQTYGTLTIEIRLTKKK